MTGIVELALGFAFAGASSAAITIWANVIVFAAAAAYGTYQAGQARKKAKASFDASVKDRLVMTATTDAPRSRIYGRARNCDGILFKASHGEKLEFYTFVIAVAGHEVDGFEDIWFADKKITRDINGYVTDAPYATQKYQTITETIPGSPTSGVLPLSHTAVPGTVWVVEVREDQSVPLPVIEGAGPPTFSGGSGTGSLVVTYQTNEGSSLARVRTYAGSPDQDLSGELIALGIPDVTSAHKFRGIAVMLVTLTYSNDAYPQGVPQMSATVRGARCFDPRNNTTAWTANPAIIARDWATYQYGGGALSSEIDDALIIASANACDVPHTFHITNPDGTTRTWLDPMYSCGIVAPTQTDPTETLQEITQAMAGKYTWAGGRLRIRAGYYSGPVATIDESWLRDDDPIAVTSGVARIDLVNVYRPSIANWENGYVVAPTEPIRAEAYIALDGQELARDLTLAGVMDIWHAQHVCGVMLRDQRQGLTVNLPCNLRAYPLDVFDVVAITLPRFGWDGKTFEVLGWEFSPAGGVNLTLKETDAVIYDPDAHFTMSDEAPNTNFPLPWYVPPPTGLSVISGTTQLKDGSILTRTLVSWDSYPLESVRDAGQIEVQYVRAHEVPAEGDWPSIRESGSAVSTVISSLRTKWVYLFRIRAINAIGVRSRWSAQIAHQIADAPLVAGGTYQQESAPTDPGTGALWEVPSTGKVYRWDPALQAWILFGGGGTVAPAIDLTPPPTVTGLAATASFSDVIVTWNVPTYTQGLGNGQTNIYAVKVAAGSTLAPTFSSATRVAEGAGATTIIAIPSDLGTRWHIWAKYQSVNGIESVSPSPAASSNGVIAQTGVVDGTDLAPLIIEARHLRAANPGLFPDQTFEGGGAVWNGFFRRSASDGSGVPAGAPFPFAAAFTGRDSVSSGFPVTVFPGEQYRLSLYCNRAGLTTEQAGVVAYVRDISGRVISTPFSPVPINDFLWQRAEVRFQIPAGGTTLLIGPWIGQAFTGTATAWFTGLLLEKMVDASLVTTNMIVAGSGAIGALAIENAAIGNLQVDNTKIANVSAAKLTIGDGTVGGNLKSSNYAPGSAGWILRTDGFVEAANADMRGTIHVGAGTLSGIDIGAGWLQSSNFDHGDGSAGFSLNSDGTVYCNNLHASGTITAKYVEADTISGLGVYRDKAQPGVVMIATGYGVLRADNVGWVDTNHPQTCIGVDENGNPTTYDCSFVTRDVIYVTAPGVTFTTNNGSTPIERRMKTGPIRFHVITTASVDFYLTNWYRRDGGGWIPLDTVHDDAPGFGQTVTQSILNLFMSTSETIEFAVTSTNAAGAWFNSGNPQLFSVTTVVTLYNF